MTYSAEARFKERRGQKDILEWTDEWEQKLENWDRLSEHEKELFRSSAMSELFAIVELGVEKTRLKLENR
jgi:hypothetical protein